MFGLRAPVPASFFGIVLGLAGLASAWRVAVRVWALPPAVADAVLAVATLAWLAIGIGYAAKWIGARDSAIVEMGYPVQCCFLGLAPVSTMLIAAASVSYAREAAWAMFVVAAAGNMLFAAWRTGGLWQGGRPAETTTAVLYLPTVAGSFVCAAGLAGFGHADWGRLFFGAGFFAWLAVESVLLHRLLTAEALAPALRPTLGIQLAPPVVGAVAYLAVIDGPPGLPADMLLGYGLLQALILARLLPWVWSGAFVPGYWAYSFGITALSLASLRMVERGETGPVLALAPVLFGLANVAIAVLAVGTLWLLVRGRLLPRLGPEARPH